MVRLEEEMNNNIVPKNLNFNSTLVRLEAIPYMLSSQKFYFNSTMVRLEASSISSHAPPAANFNSTMVRLEERVAKVIITIVLHFNSTMVRLEGISIVTGGS